MMSRSGAVWVPAWMVAGMAAAVALRIEGMPLSWWMPLGVAVFAIPAAVIVSMATNKPWAVFHRGAAVLAECVWVTVVARTGWSEEWVLGLVGGAVVVAALEFTIARERVVVEWARDMTDVDRRPETVRDWEGVLRRLTKKPIGVRDVRPWANRQDGEQVHVDLPEDITVKDLAGYCDKIAAARRLPQGCVVRALDAEHQGAAILDVMLRDCLAGEGRMIEEPTTATSINEPFEVALTPRGESLEVHLRQKTVVIGGTTGSGKTTLLHRIIMRLARCMDVLIWIVDPNGGGVAAPWIEPWARKKASAPTVDWVADDECEGAVLLAVANKIIKDRKTSKEAYSRRRAANTSILPVDKDLPLILVLTDEGGELRQMAGMLATLVDEGIARLAQIGRAEGGRLITSVLRGTGDLLNKGFRSVAGIRICLRMDETDEYGHVLGVNPGKARLLHVGSAYVYRTDTDYRPVLARTVNVDPNSIERHAIATANLRPKLDDRGRKVAAQITAREVLGGRDSVDFPEFRKHPVYADLRAGMVYENRWERKKAMLAELRGEELAEVDVPTAPAIPDRPTVAPIGSAAERLLLGTGVTLERQRARAEVTSGAENSPPQDMDAEAERLLSAEHLALDGTPGQPEKPETAREAIVLALRDAHPDLLTVPQVHTRITEMGVDVSRSRVHQVVDALAEKGRVRQVGSGYELTRE